MKRKTIGLVLSLVVCLSAIGEQAEASWPILEGPYLGQTPPGTTPEIFAPGLISTEEKYELNSVFSPEGDEFYFEISTTTDDEKSRGIYFYIIMVSKQVNGVWTKPQVAPFSGGEYITCDMFFSPDGNRLYFSSNRPLPWKASARMPIWYVDRRGNGWSEPKPLGPPVFSSESGGQGSMSRNGSLYFRRGDDLYYAKFDGEKFLKPVLMGEEINTPYSEGKPYIAPDESYLMFIRYGMPESIDGGRGMYISFRKKEGGWTVARNIGIRGSMPRPTLDGKLFFFSRDKDIYWVDARVIDQLN
jgi:hypothetical protein